MKTIGSGSIQRSMGGAGVALPLDSSVSISNPAGIVKLDKRIDLGGTFFTPKVNYSAVGIAGQVTNNNVKVNSHGNSCLIPGLGIVFPKKDKFSFALGAYGTCGMGVNYESNLYNNITYTEYSAMKLAPVAAYSVNDKFSVGIAPTLNYAQMDYNVGTPAEVAHHNGSAYGFGYIIGFLYEISGELSFGISYESKQNYSDFEFDTISGRDRLEFDQPQNVSVGIGVKPNKRFRLAFDVVWIDWPQTNGENKPAYTENSSNAALWNMNWEEQFVYKIGFEYDFNDKVNFRAGYNYGKNPLDKTRSFENISFPAIAEKHITCGTTIVITKEFSVNLGFMYSPKVTLDTANTAQFINSAITQMSQYSVDAGITYKF